MQIDSAVLPPVTRYPFKIKVEVEWPNTVEYDGETYFFYHKVGVRISDQCPVACYQCITEDNLDKRLWLGLDGQIEED